MSTSLGSPNFAAIFFFFLIVSVTLAITYWAARRTRSTEHFYAAGRSVTGFQNGETIATATSGDLTFTTLATPTSNVGSYAITCSGLTASNGNYVFVQALGNTSALTVDPAALTITASNAAKTYGQTLNFAGTEFSAPGSAKVRGKCLPPRGLRVLPR